MGGLAAMYAHFKHPAAFGSALCMSPSFWFAKKAIFRFVAAATSIFSGVIDCEAIIRSFGFAAIT